MAIIKSYECRNVLSKEKKEEWIKGLQESYKGFNFPETHNGMERILEEYERKKGWILKAFRKHPHYNGNGQIVIPSKIKRETDMGKVREFLEWYEHELYDIAQKKQVKIGLDEKGMQKRRGEFFSTHRPFYELGKPYLDYVYVTNETHANLSGWSSLMKLVLKKRENISYIPDDEDFINTANAYLKNAGVRWEIHARQKTSKVVQKILKETKINEVVDLIETKYETPNGEIISRVKDLGYNYHMALLGDAINPLCITRDVVLSVQPEDYLLSSNGTTWETCQSPSKKFFRGMYMSGVLSYMLDPSTIVVYQRPSLEQLNSNGWAELPLEKQPKARRCLFYLGEDKLIQSRVYPDGRDYGDQSVAAQLREIVQTAIATIFDASNMWKTVKGCKSACENIHTDPNSTHFPDYARYEDVATSYLRVIDGEINENKITVGSTPICACCGESYSQREALVCSDCIPHVTCSCCGEVISENYCITAIDGTVFCCEDCALDSNYEFCEDVVRWCNEYEFDEWSRTYFHDMSNMVCVEGRYGTYFYSCPEHAREDGFFYATYDDCWTARENCLEIGNTGEYFVATNRDYIEAEDGLTFPTAEIAIANGYQLDEETDAFVLVA